MTDIYRFTAIKITLLKSALRTSLGGADFLNGPLVFAKRSGDLRHVKHVARGKLYATLLVAHADIAKIIIVDADLPPSMLRAERLSPSLRDCGSQLLSKRAVAGFRQKRKRLLAVCLAPVEFIARQYRPYLYRR
ncbi:MULTISPECIES: hypothetical protein [unclassified Mesorhizobium]|uniref:hypothetical protein n=1 Tax=unclassified Mesorhizobium TaxID=325217 RepID=UPI000FD8204C|nr:MULTISPECIES: hypothetical protein [unclassified Mesorhizobium]TGR58279.1 hypothetical protein EN842_01415 [bacterium M00.F.Ca.ET.199.01.1.1]TGU41613.1 hypothetical protein EN799_03400 [bacterium M00.F.Ca.ET.156.01.1.1]TGR33021.1 hypothetical protein EN840_01415 [Mesorhizobium sp. M8A.F.Ca.ET.197.01.1.1]TGR34667.1 hypothetical protein EN845_01415 [Mesorhizobium sp. M8A.F.Ca.ET.202.01.1.1]TGR59210.1 hypothetical protein EN841_01415 [Mesorhizobium sp. M8A.F.Ca.ET.198.01.1.1]